MRKARPPIKRSARASRILTLRFISATEDAAMQNFGRFAFAVQRVSGSPQVFCAACAGVLLWLLAGPVFHWSNGWELVVNTVTTIISFLLLFAVQGALNRQSDED